MTKEITDKYEKLKSILSAYGSLAVAFSGGVDSTFLLVTAKEVLGENLIAVTARIQSMPEAERDAAASFCEKESIRLLTVDFDELSIPGFAGNPPNRCYICKRAIFTILRECAGKEGFRIVAEGSNADDTSDYRPGMQALSELGIKSPLLEAGLTKGEIRLLSGEMNLPTWNQPSKACLSSRFAYGETITKEKLRMVDEAESYLSEFGIAQLRVRMHANDLARIEVLPEDFETVTYHRSEIDRKFRELGFRYVSLDLKGFRSGSMNEALGDSSQRK